MEDINLHFTGDIHAISAANNLLSAMIDNHIFHGNELGFKRVVWKRCIDLNDRKLRKITCGQSKEKGMTEREDGFDITVASEIMAVLCLSKDIADLKKRISKIIVGYNEKEEPITAHDLKAEGSLTVLLKDAINPNLVQTLENTPAIVHGGPFANIAHGCNSIRATKLGLKIGEYCVTEAGFGADLGAEKFLDIKCRMTGLKPSAVVCVATMRALKYHGGAKKEEVQEENMEALEKGMHNLLRHVNNIKNKFGLNVIVAINKFLTDTDREIEFVKHSLEEKKVNMSLVEAWAKGGEGAKDLAEKVVKLAEMPENFKYIYGLDEEIEEKIRKVAKNIYGAEDVEFEEEAIESIKQIKKLGFGNLPVCIAKTQYSFSDDAKNLECTEPFNIHVREIILKAGAGFIVAITGKIMTMPGLPKVPAAENIDIDENGDIEGIF